MSDAETMTLLREIAASEAGLPPTLGSRISGSTIGELRADAAALASQLGVAPEEPARERDEAGRDEAGRFARTSSSFNRMIRDAAGH